MSTKRKRLQVLQPTAHDQRLLTGRSGVIGLNDDKKRKSQLPHNENCSSTKLQKTDGEFAKLKDRPQFHSQKRLLMSEKSEEEKVKRIKVAVEETTQDCNEDEHDVFEMLTRANPPQSYWKELAEERRKALEEALIENEELHEKVASQQAEIEALKQERDLLQEMASEADGLANILQNLAKDEQEIHT